MCLGWVRFADSCTQTEHLSKGKASLFLTPQDMQLRLQMPSD